MPNEVPKPHDLAPQPKRDEFNAGEFVESVLRDFRIRPGNFEFTSRVTTIVQNITGFTDGDLLELKAGLEDNRLYDKCHNPGNEYDRHGWWALANLVEAVLKDRGALPSEEK